MEGWVQSDKGSTNVLTMQKSQPGFEWCWHIKGHCWPQKGRSFLERDKTIWENAAEALDSLVNYAGQRPLCSAAPEVMNLNMLHPTFRTNRQTTPNQGVTGDFVRKTSSWATLAYSIQIVPSKSIKWEENSLIDKSLR